MNQVKQSQQDDSEKFRDVAIDGWELGKSDFLAGKALHFSSPQTYYEKAYFLGYMEMKHAENCDLFREIANEGFQLGESDCLAGKGLYFHQPQTYYEKGYVLGYALTKKNLSEIENEKP